MIIYNTQPAPSCAFDKEKGTYQNRERGIYKFNIAIMEYSELSPKQFPDVCINDMPLREKLILDFGDTNLVDQFLDDSGLKIAIDAVKCKNADTFYAMLYCYILCSAIATQHHGLKAIRMYYIPKSKAFITEVWIEYTYN